MDALESQKAGVSRPIYETPQDLANEDRVALAIQRAWGGEVRRMQRIDTPYPTIDRALYRNKKMVGTIEIKCRTQWYYTMLISAAKFLHNANHSIRTNIPHCIVFAVDDDIRYHVIDHSLAYMVRKGGRTDRSDKYDEEFCVYIHQSWLRKLRTKHD